MPGYFEDLRRRSSDYSYGQTPGFFTPFQSGSDFFDTLVKPITGPLLLGTLSIFYAVGAAASVVLGLGLIALGLILTPLILCAPEAPFLAFGVGFSFCSHALDLTMGAFLLALGTVIALVINPIVLLTRTAASIVDGVASCCEAEGQEFSLQI
jgi:hypothetical protein